MLDQARVRSITPPLKKTGPRHTKTTLFSFRLARSKIHTCYNALKTLKKIRYR
jgi:hypothetical protein